MRMRKYENILSYMTPEDEIKYAGYYIPKSPE